MPIIFKNNEEDPGTTLTSGANITYEGTALDKVYYKESEDAEPVLVWEREYKMGPSTVSVHAGGGGTYWYGTYWDLSKYTKILADRISASVTAGYWRKPTPEEIEAEGTDVQEVRSTSKEVYVSLNGTQVRWSEGSNRVLDISRYSVSQRSRVTVGVSVSASFTMATGSYVNGDATFVNLRAQ